MTESNTPTPLEPVTPLVPVAPVLSAPPEGVAFHEQVSVGRGHSTATRVGVITGSALLVLVGVAAAMGASPGPSGPVSAVGADPSASATAPAPAASADPNTTQPNGTDPDHDGPHDGAGKGFRGGFPGGGRGFGVGFRDITITAINGSSLSLKTEDGWTRTITVTDSTTITKGGATIAIGDLAVGDSIRFREVKATDGTYSVTAIVVVLPTVVGQISAIDGDTITVTQPGGTTATIHVDSNTKYRVAGNAGSLSDLKVGSFIIAEGTQRSDGSLDAAAVRGGIGKGRQGHPGFPDGLGPKDAPASPAPSSGAS